LARTPTKRLCQEFCTVITTPIRAHTGLSLFRASWEEEEEEKEEEAGEEGEVEEEKHKPAKLNSHGVRFGPSPEDHLPMKGAARDLAVQVDLYIRRLEPVLHSARYDPLKAVKDKLAPMEAG